MKMDNNDRDFYQQVCAYVKSGGTLDKAREIINMVAAGTVPVRAHSRGTADHRSSADKAIRRVPAAPRGPSLSAAKAVAKKNADTIWNRVIGGTITVGGSTKHHWQTVARKSVAMGHISHRMLTEIEWPDDVTPLEKIATKKQVEAIIASGYDAIEAEYAS